MSSSGYLVPFGLLATVVQFGQTTFEKGSTTDWLCELVIDLPALSFRFLTRQMAWKGDRFIVNTDFWTRLNERKLQSLIPPSAKAGT